MLKKIGSSQASRFVISGALGLAITSSCVAQCEIDQVLAGDAVGGDQFGEYLNAHGIRFVIGARGRDAVYVFSFDGETWEEEAKLEADDPFADSFGPADIAAGVVVVGSSGYGEESEGRVYVFRYNGAEWKLESELTPADTQPQQRFGVSVAIQDDLIVVGAEHADAAEPTIGAAYVFRWDGNCWLEEVKLMASDGATDDGFGFSVALHTPYVVVGASGNDDNGELSGSAYVFRYDGEVWNEELKLAPRSLGPGDRFGFPVAMSQSFILVAATEHPAAGDEAGAVYGYQLIEGEWTEDAKIVAPHTDADDHFGDSIDIVEDGNFVVCIIGSPFDDAPHNESGSADTFRRIDGAWTWAKRLVPSDTNTFGRFGDGVALGDDYLVVTARDGFLDTGAGYLYVLDEEDCNENAICDVRELELGLSEDCNHNDTPDDCDIANGTSQDVDQNGVPDECEVIGDLNGDGVVGTSDLLILLGFWGSCLDCEDCLADIDNDCLVGTLDLLILLGNWG